MCLYNNFEVAKKLVGQNRLIKCYKVLELKSECGHFKYISPYYGHYFWKNGINKSNSKLKSRPSSDGIIDEGIHVFRTRELATNDVLLWKSYSRRKFIVVPVFGHSKDIIGANNCEIAFDKVRFDRPKKRPKPKK